MEAGNLEYQRAECPRHVVIETNRAVGKHCILKFVFGQGDFVFIAAEGSYESKPCAYLDLYRVENGKIVERWGFPEEVPPQTERINNAGML
jgi:predicted SnoaL-like aldol condensation-catalyzing enzyme